MPTVTEPLRRHIHRVVALSRNIWYRCEACRFEGTLEEAVVHAVFNQYAA